MLVFDWLPGDNRPQRADDPIVEFRAHLKASSLFKYRITIKVGSVAVHSFDIKEERLDDFGLNGHDHNPAG